MTSGSAGRVLTVLLTLLLTNGAGPSRTGSDGDTAPCASTQVRLDTAGCTSLLWTGGEGRHRPSKPLRRASPPGGVDSRPPPHGCQSVADRWPFRPLTGGFIWCLTPNSGTWSCPTP